MNISKRLQPRSCEKMRLKRKSNNFTLLIFLAWDYTTQRRLKGCYLLLYDTLCIWLVMDSINADITIYSISRQRRKNWLLWTLEHRLYRRPYSYTQHIIRRSKFHCFTGGTMIKYSSSLEMFSCQRLSSTVDDFHNFPFTKTWIYHFQNFRTLAMWNGIK